MELLCNRCHKILPAEQFRISGTLYSICRDCTSIEFLAKPKPKPHPPVVGEIYFVQSQCEPNLIKIGFTRVGVAYRLKVMRNATPCPLKLLGVMSGTIPDERALHRRFNALRLHGEWFRSHKWLLTYIAEFSSLKGYDA